MKSRYLFQILIILVVLSTTNCRGERGRGSSSSTRTRSERAVNERETSRSGNKQNPTERKRSSKTFSGEEIFEKYNSAVFVLYVSDWFGADKYDEASGFFLTSTGIGVSNYHDFDGREYIKLSDGSTYKIRSIIKEDPVQDYIIFQVESNRSNFNYIPIGKRAPKVRAKVFAIGNPHALENNTISEGIISGLRGNNMFQISIPLDYGSSGGALINEYGEVIGVTTRSIYPLEHQDFAIDIRVIERYIK